MHRHGRAHSMCVTIWKKLYKRSEFEKNTFYKNLLMKYSKKNEQCYRDSKHQYLLGVQIEGKWQLNSWKRGIFNV